MIGVRSSRWISRSAQPASVSSRSRGRSGPEAAAIARHDSVARGDSRAISAATDEIGWISVDADRMGHPRGTMLLWRRAGGVGMMRRGRPEGRLSAPRCRRLGGGGASTGRRIGRSGPAESRSLSPHKLTASRDRIARLSAGSTQAVSPPRPRGQADVARRLT